MPNPSELRPHCFAIECMRKWKPVNAQRDGSVVGEQALARVLQVMESAWEGKTRMTYGSGLLAYHVYGDKHEIPEDKRAPVSREVMAAFIASLAGAYSGKTIRNYVFGIRAWHVLHGAPWILNKPESPGGLDITKPKDAAVYACLTSAFWGTTRVGELTVEKQDDKFNKEVDVTPANMTTETDREGNKTTRIQIPKTKTEDDRQGIYWAKQNGESDPEAAMDNHIRINNPARDSHLFAYKAKNKMKLLSTRVFLNRIKEAAEAVGLKPLCSHGIRIGSTLEYLLRGMPFQTMKTKSRWRSDAF
ncbi:hypothetical protein BKA70DRAFT_1374745 [Coprinopsis sp. MPI-PUGE-AT-0042]|nr:hypothetical protein BKA70DRAFT_1374745 [Coprinopsis sp. MPI-PUGE-AT-0042]